MKLKSLWWVALAIAATMLAQPASATGWTGCYLGAQAGMAATNTGTSIDVAGVGSVLDVKGLGSSGGVFGLHAGCDVKLEQFVVGGFADYAWHNQSIEIQSPALGAQIAKLDLNNQWTIGARAGLLFGNTLAYGLVGYTKAGTSDLSVLNGAAAFDLKAWEGITFGGGLETEIMPNIRLGLEYRYVKFDKQDVTLVPGFLSAVFHPEQHTAMARLSYAFPIAK